MRTSAARDLPQCAHLWPALLLSSRPWTAAKGRGVRRCAATSHAARPAGRTCGLADHNVGTHGHKQASGGLGERRGAAAGERGALTIPAGVPKHNHSSAVDSHTALRDSVLRSIAGIVSHDALVVRDPSLGL